MELALHQPLAARERSTKRRPSLGRLMDSSVVLLLVAIATLIIILALLILFHHNVNATKGYSLRSLEYERNQLLLEQEHLNMDIAKAQALENLESDPQIQTMQKIRRPTYAPRDEAAALSKLKE